MAKNLRSFNPEFRQKPDKAFRRTVWLQIYIPLIFIILLVIGFVTILWTGGVGTFSGWADTALIFLLIPALLVGLIIFVIIAALCYGIFYLIGWIPGPSKEVQRVMRRVTSETRRYADLVSRPFFAPSAAKSALVKAIRHLASIFSTE
jgi:fatty acid desaturase